MISYDDDQQQGDVDAFTQEIAASSYWAATTSEYGVGPLTVGPAVHRGGSPGSISEDQLLNDLAANTGPGKPWGPLDRSTIYTFLIPGNTSFTDSQGGSCCSWYGGFHNEATIQNEGIVYSIICECQGLDDTTITISHELIEAATDPYVNSAPAYEMPDQEHAAWTLLTSGEVGDMCEYEMDAYFTPGDMSYAVQRTWSNAAAKAGHDPCVPAANEPYVAAAPVVKDTLSLDWYGLPFQAKGVKIPVGGQATIDVDLFSDRSAPAWSLRAWDYNEIVTGSAPNLQLSLDQDSGSNGDVRKLTIKVLSKNTDLGAEVFIIESDLGDEQSFWVGVVGD